MYEMFTNNILFDSVDSVDSDMNPSILQLKSIMKICGKINEEIVPQDIELPTKCINEIIYDKLCEFNIRDKNLANIIGVTVVIDPSKRPSINDLDKMISSI